MGRCVSLVGVQARADGGNASRAGCAPRHARRAGGAVAMTRPPRQAFTRSQLLKNNRAVLCQGASDSGATGSMNEDGTITLPDVQLKAGENGKYTVNGTVELASKPADVYEVLVDFAGAHNIFSNIEATEVVTENGKTTLLQKCRWTFLVFSGTFNAALSVREIPEQRVLLFDLVKSGFMQEFEGRWKVMESENGGSIVEHNLTVKPSMAPPGGLMSGYTRKIFVEQEIQVLKDLELELERRAAPSLAAVPASIED